jgi:DNA-directed RNA polymerase subunit RPC12/RpoP
MKCSMCGEDVEGLHYVNTGYMCIQCSGNEIIDHGWYKKHE